jgi:hypothetical protein
MHAQRICRVVSGRLTAGTASSGSLGSGEPAKIGVLVRFERLAIVGGLGGDVPMSRCGEAGRQAGKPRTGEHTES